MNNNELTLYDRIIDSIPLYFKKFISVTGVVIFTTFVLYILHATAISYTSSYFLEIGAVYFNHPINLWSFYTYNINLLLMVLASFVFFIGCYILGSAGVVNPVKQSIWMYFLYNFLVGLVICSIFLGSKTSEIATYAISVILFTLCMGIAQYKSIKNEKALQKKEGVSQNNKIWVYFAIFAAIIYWLFFPFIGIFITNNYFAGKSGRKDGSILLEKIQNNTYIDNKGSAIIKETGEHVYVLSCDTSSCFIIRKDAESELQFEFINSHAIILLYKK